MNNKQPKFFPRVWGGLMGGAVGVIALVRAIAEGEGIVYVLSAAIVGAFIGAGIGISEKSAPKTICGIIFGLIGGMVAVVPVLFLDGLGLWWRSPMIVVGIYWAVVGAFVGAGIGISEKSDSKIFYGIIFGFIGGAIGGALGGAIGYPRPVNMIVVVISGAFIGAGVSLADICGE